MFVDYGFSACLGLVRWLLLVGFVGLLVLLLEGCLFGCCVVVLLFVFVVCFVGCYVDGFGVVFVLLWPA